MNILMLGLNDPAGMMIAFANAINRYTEHRARCISLRTVYSVDFEYDLELPRIKDEDFSEIEHLLKTSDIFHFHMLMDENYQLGPLEIKNYLKGKGILHHHHGTYDHQCFLATAEQYRKKYQQLKRRSIVSTPDLLKLLPEATWQPNLVPLYEAAYLPRFDHQTCSETVKIVQAPTRKWHKHTKEFLAVCKRLETRLPQLRYEIIEGVAHREVLRRKRTSHAVFDHMNGWFGISSLESLAHGLPVIAGLDDSCLRAIADFTGSSMNPWVVARDESQLEEKLEFLITHPEDRLRIGQESRDFMEQHWNEEKVLSLLLDTYCQL